MLHEDEVDRDVIHVPLCFISAKVTTERTEVPPYPMDEVENKYRFIRHVEKTEKIAILKTDLPSSYS